MPLSAFYFLPTVVLCIRILFLLSDPKIVLFLPGGLPECSARSLAQGVVL